ncbi:MAG: hypothetical protein AAGB29_07080 [Planctomycetota bacterium]
MPLICHKCEYDLTGNESGCCPECGEPVEASLAARRRVVARSRRDVYTLQFLGGLAWLLALSGLDRLYFWWASSVLTVIGLLTAMAFLLVGVGALARADNDEFALNPPAAWSRRRLLARAATLLGLQALGAIVLLAIFIGLARGFGD